MTQVTPPPMRETDAAVAQPLREAPKRRTRSVSSLFATGEPMIWLTGGAMLLCVIMILCLLSYVIVMGMSTFAVLPIEKFSTSDGHTYMGEVTRYDHYKLDYNRFFEMAEDQAPAGQLLHPLLHDRLSKITSSIQAKDWKPGSGTPIEIEPVADTPFLASVQGSRELVHDSIIYGLQTSSALRGPRARKLVDNVRQRLDRDFEKFAAKAGRLLYLALQADHKLEAADPDYARGQFTYHLWESFRRREQSWINLPTPDDKLKAIESDDHVLFAMWFNRLMTDWVGELGVDTSRLLVRTGNYRLTQTRSKWLNEFAIDRPDDPAESLPQWAIVMERQEWSRFYGFPEAFIHVRQYVRDEDNKPINNLEKARAKALELAKGIKSEDGGEIRLLVEAPVQGKTIETTIRPDEIDTATKIIGVAEVIFGPAETYERLVEHHDDVLERLEDRRYIEKIEIGEFNHHQETARLELTGAKVDLEEAKEAELRGTTPSFSEDVPGLMKGIGALLVLVTAGLAGYFGFARANAGSNRFRYRLMSNLMHIFIVAGVVMSVIYLFVVVGLIGNESVLSVEVAQERLDAAQKHYDEVRDEVGEAFIGARQRIDEINDKNGTLRLLMRTPGEGEIAAEPTVIPLDQIVRAYPANQVSFGEKAGIYMSRWWEFLFDDPREANTEGGIWPALVGTVVMTLIMAIAVVPFGVLAALYIREYAKAGPIISAVRIAINNLAGVPSIVFGVFGLGFFCYIVGSYVDRGPTGIDVEPMAGPGWWILLGITAVISAIAFACWLSASQSAKARTGSLELNKILSAGSGVLWLVFIGLFVYLLVTIPYFGGLFEARAYEGSPTFGKGGLIWASMTLALLTLPVVIVATEEALAAVPNSMREGSYACGASKWQTIKRIVLPRAMPGIMTGTILAMARGAGEVAPLMLVGAVKLAPELPVDGMAPFLHPDRSFMHLGFHIYDVGFQSPDSEAAKPMVFTTTLLLILIVALLNLTAIFLRSRLKRRFAGSQF